MSEQPEHNIATLHEAVAEVAGDRECIVWRDRRLTWAEVTERTRRLANALLDRGLGMHGSLGGCAGWESPHDHVALYLHNGNEYLEGMLGAYKARLAPFNVNYRYVAEELAYVLRDAGARAVVFHSAFAPTLAEVRGDLPALDALLQVDDGSGAPLLDGAAWYEDALAAASPERPPLAWSPDDLYILYTGGTTGMPKGVLWRQTDFLHAAIGVRAPLDEIVRRAAEGGLRALPSPPFMHGAAHWNALSAWVAGGTVVVQDDVTHLDPADLLRVCERERVTSLQIVGDSFARPLIDELHRASYDLSALRFVMSGGAVLSASVKRELLDLVPGVRIVDILGSSETGRQGVSSGATSTFEREGTSVVLSADRARVIEPGDDEIGWLAQTGRVPRGYLGDEAKTRETFPVVDGVRYAVAGDRARLSPDGGIELHGRDSVTINTGGEKVFAEEVESALKHHPAVYDALVVGRPSERWGEEVVAVVQLRAGAAVTDDDLRDEAARHLARYKLPKAFVYADRVERSPSGKPDYRWARDQASSTQ